MDNVSNETTYLDFLKEKRQFIRNEIKHLPDENLLISNGKNGLSFHAVKWENDKRKVTGIARNQRLIYKLAHKAYLLELLKRIENNINILEISQGKLLPTEFEDIKDSLPKHFDVLKEEAIINPRILSGTEFQPHPVGDGSVRPLKLYPTLDEMFADSPITAEEWFTLPYCENTSYADTKRHITESGLRVRSKSEGLCIGCYNARKVLYHYDETFISGGNWISPDAIMLRSDNTFLIHEHGGFPDKEEYMHDFYSKLITYYKAGFRLGKNLIVTFDNRNGDIDMRLLNNLLEDYYY